MCVCSRYVCVCVCLFQVCVGVCVFWTEREKERGADREDKHFMFLQIYLALISLHLCRSLSDCLSVEENVHLRREHTSGYRKIVTMKD